MMAMYGVQLDIATCYNMWPWSGLLLATSNPAMMDYHSSQMARKCNVVPHLKHCVGA